MTWHTSTTDRDGLLALIAQIRARGGTIASCLRSSEGLIITWFVLDKATA